MQISKEATKQLLGKSEQSNIYKRVIWYASERYKVSKSEMNPPPSGCPNSIKVGSIASTQQFHIKKFLVSQFVVIQNIKKVIYTGVKNLNVFSGHTASRAR